MPSAVPLAFWSAGRSRDARIAMTAITTRSSINVNVFFFTSLFHDLPDDPRDLPFFSCIFPVSFPFSLLSLSLLCLLPEGKAQKNFLPPLCFFLNRFTPSGRESFFLIDFFLNAIFSHLSLPGNQNPLSSGSGGSEKRSSGIVRPGPLKLHSAKYRNRRSAGPDFALFRHQAGRIFPGSCRYLYSMKF